MLERERQLMRKKLDKEMKYFRWAERGKMPTVGWMRAIRMALGVPVAEILKRLKVSHSVFFRLEQSEMRGTISLKRLDRMARAMDCRVVYAIVPCDGRSLDNLAEQRLWRKVLGSREEK
jgi:predicted DNA-binding mobile mystery protein A